MSPLSPLLSLSLSPSPGEICAIFVLFFLFAWFFSLDSFYFSSVNFLKFYYFCHPQPEFPEFPTYHFP